MQTYMTKMMAAAQEMALAAVTEFVEHAKAQGVDIPETMVADFFSGQGVKMTKTGKVSKASARKTGRGTGKASPGKRTPMFDYLGEELPSGERRRDELKATLNDELARVGTISELEEHFADEPKQLEKCTSLLQWFEDHEVGAKGVPAHVVNKLGGLMWAALSEEERQRYKAGAKAANQQLAEAPAQPEPEPEPEAPAQPEPEPEDEDEPVTCEHPGCGAPVNWGTTLCKQHDTEIFCCMEGCSKTPAEGRHMCTTHLTAAEPDSDTESRIESDSDTEPDEPEQPECSIKRCTSPAMEGSTKCEKHFTKELKVAARRQKRAQEAQEADE